LLIERENIARLGDIDDDVVLLARGNLWIDPFDGLRIGADRGVNQRPLVNVVGIPIVGG